VTVSGDQKALRRAMEDLARERCGGSGLAGVTRRPWGYRSSFTLDEIVVDIEGGDRLRFLLKDVAASSLSIEARRIKPEFLLDPLREIETYRRVLHSAVQGCPEYYGSVVEPAAGRYWLFLELVEGRELYQIGDLTLWQAAARWLAALHCRFDTEAKRTIIPSRAIVQDRAYFQTWMDRAWRFLGSSGPADARRELAWLHERYEQIVERLTGLPVTFLHGEFYASNVLVSTGGDHPRICPVDWELTAIGPGLMDLAALISGDWTEEHRSAIAGSYYEECRELGGRVPERGAFDESLDVCRLAVAVYWLGWFGRREPNERYRHGWLDDAVQLARRLGL
jgi:thiamine kinase-like enzyme